MLALLQTIEAYASAYVITSLVLLNMVDSKTGMRPSLWPTRKWEMISVQYNLSESLFRETQKWWRENAAREFARVGIALDPGFHPKSGRYFDLRLPRGSSLVAARVASRRISHVIHEKQINYILRTTGRSRLSLFLEYTLPLGTSKFLGRNTPPHYAAVAFKVTEVMARNSSHGMLHLNSLLTTVSYLATIQHWHCCWKPLEDDEETLLWRASGVRQILGIVKDELLLHHLHCVEMRKGGYRDKQGKPSGGWSQVTQNIGNPFGDSNKGFRPLTRMPQTLTRIIYTVDMLKELGEYIRAKKIEKQFLADCVLRYGVVLLPQAYATLQRKVKAGELSLQQAAWLYHSNVPVGDIHLCFTLIPHAASFAQAKILVKEGVIPELLEALRARGLLEGLNTEQIITIHRRCEEEETEQILALLKTGIAPERLRLALYVHEQFPDKTPEDIRDELKLKSKQSDAGVTLHPFPSPRRPRPNTKRGTSPPATHEHGMTQPPAIKERITPAMIPLMKHRQLVSQLKRNGWRAVGKNAGPHMKFQDARGMTLTIPRPHGSHMHDSVSRYTLYRALSQTGISREDAEKIFSNR